MRTEVNFHQHKGQNIVEFAFVLPVLLVLIGVIINLAVLFHCQMIITNAAWEGARAGATIVNPETGDQEIVGAVEKAIHGLDPLLLAVEIKPAQNEFPRNQEFPAPRGAFLEVIVSYQVPLSFLGFAVPITGRAVTTIEYQNP